MDFRNNMLLTLYTLIIGAVAGSIIWCFIRGMNFGIYFIWDYLPGLINFEYYTIIVCVIGGLLIGLWKNKYGDIEKISSQKEEE